MSLRQVLIAVASILAIGLAPCTPATAQYLSAPPAPPRPAAPRDVCHEEFGGDYDPYGRWIGSVVTTLCNDGNADSKLAVYLMTVPAVEGMRQQPDDALLARALEGVGKNDAPLLFLAAIHASGADCSDGLAHAKSLTTADPENGFAWLTRAFVAATCEEDADEVASSLTRAARSHRFHDYGFDITKRVAARLARVPIPAEIVASRHAGTADGLRFDIIQEVLIPTTFLSMEIVRRLPKCSGETSSSSDEPRVACADIRRGLSSYGDSAVLLMDDPERYRSAIADADVVHARQSDFAKVAMRAIAQSHSEIEFYRRARALMGEPKASAKTP